MTYLDDRMVIAPAVPDAQSPHAAGAHDLIDAVIAALRTVHDPEIPVNIYDLGLIYRIAPGDQGLSRST